MTHNAPSAQEDDQPQCRIALCLGAHRSGTSLLTAAMEAVGAELSLPSHNASEENLKGFFEHSEVVELDDALLRLADSAWDDGMFDSGNLAMIAAPDKEALQAQAQSIIEDQLRTAALSAVKDPRMCRLLPFWFPVLSAAGYTKDDIRCVIVTRDPAEIAISQRTRCQKNPDYYEFGRDLSEGITLWLSHIRQALRDCAGRDVLVIAYRDFLDRPAELMQRLAAFLGAQPDHAAIDDFIAESVTRALWRSHADDSALAEIEAAFPGLLEIERELAAMSGEILHDQQIAPILTALNDPAYDQATERVVSTAYGRLSDRRRAERVLSLQTEHALTVTREARDAFARSRDEIVATAKGLEERLRERIHALEAGITDRETRIAQNCAQHEVIQTEMRKVEGNLRDRIGVLESAVTERDSRLQDLRSKQDAAIQQIGAAFARNEHELEQARQELQQLQQQAAALAEDLLRHKDENVALLDRWRESETQLSGLAAQLANTQEVSSYLQQVNEAMRASHSWRLTQPLRAVGTIARGVKSMPKQGLRALNRVSQVSHQRLKRSHPKTAELIRRNIQPLMTRANMKLLGQYHVPAPPSVQKGAFAFDYQLPRVYPAFRPLVSIIVPNYNHAPYLTKRLESIFAQTYENFEVLLMDDCSPDNSRDVLNEFAARYPDRTRTLFNETNSGGVFHQWEKGIAAARGDLIWIAESDDWASPNFLETLVPFFQNEAVQLAYARTIFMDAAGENQTWSMEEYLNAFGPERWGRAWVETAPDIVRDVFSMTNIIPNASSAVFRRFERLDVLEIEQWRSMRTCGDWMFYLNAIRGGMLAYSPDAQNFYRIHDKNTSVTSHKADQFYREHEEVAKCARRHYSVPEDNLGRMEANLRHHWKITRADYSDQAFTACFDRDRIAAAPRRKPALLMVSYAFCAGGGETFPIQLANEMKAIGYEVTFLDCAQEERVPGVRARLAADIPVISNFPDLQRIVQNFDIDLIHSHHGWADNTVLDILPENADCRTVITLHGFYETVPPEQLKQLLPRLLRRTGAMVYIAEKNLGAMQRDGIAPPDYFHRIDNAVSKANIAPIDRAALGIAEDAFVLTVVSRALHAKGWAEAIASTTRAREISGRDIHLVLVGDGEAKGAAEAAGVPDYVHLEGFRSNTQDYFAAADLGFLPSRFKGESFPLVVIESLITGTPVLASRIGEIPYMLGTEDGPAGALFDLDDWQIDIEAVAQQIADLATDPDKMARLRARVPLAAERFDPRIMAEKYDAVYRGVITGKA